MKTTSYQSILGLVFRDKREDLKVTQKQIADALSMTTAGWSKIEKGQSAISVANLNKAAKVLGVSTSSILIDVEQATKELEKQDWVISNEKIEEDDLSKGWRFASAAAAATSISGISATAPIAATLASPLLGVFGLGVAVALAGYTLYKSAVPEENKDDLDNEGH